MEATPRTEPPEHLPPARPKRLEGDRLVALAGDEPWVWWHIFEGPDVHARLDVSGPRVAITGLGIFPVPGALSGTGVVTASDLRDVPLGRLEALVNEPRIAAKLRVRLGDSALDAGVRRAVPKSAEVLVSTPQLGPGLRFRLGGVADTPRPDSFYAHLAETWAEALRSGRTNPAVVIAEANGVNPSAVHRWVREARRRGVMAPSSRAVRSS